MPPRLVQVESWVNHIGLPQCQGAARKTWVIKSDEPLFTVDETTTTKENITKTYAHFIRAILTYCTIYTSVTNNHIEGC